jgi:hypothetical protein
MKSHAQLEIRSSTVYPRLSEDEFWSGWKICMPNSEQSVPRTTWNSHIPERKKADAISSLDISANRRRSEDISGSSFSHARIISLRRRI